MSRLQKPLVTIKSHSEIDFYEQPVPYNFILYNLGYKLPMSDNLMVTVCQLSEHGTCKSTP